jgi:hypothetical protein
MRRQATVQRTEARRQHINRERARVVGLQYTVYILRQQEQRQEPPLEQMQHQSNINPPPPPLPYNQIPHHHPPPPPYNQFPQQPPPSPHHDTTDPKSPLANHHLRHTMTPQTLKARWPTTCNSHRGPCITEPHHCLSTMATSTPANSSCATKPPSPQPAAMMLPSPNPLSFMLVFFCTGKIQGGQDHALQF